MSCSVKCWEEDRKSGNMLVKDDRPGLGDTLHRVIEGGALGEGDI